MEDLAALVIRARDGDADAFGAIVRRFQDMAVGYSYSLIGDLHLAEDAAQEAFLEAYLCLPGLREPAAFPGWFRRIVFKQCDRLTRARRGVFHSLQTVEERSSPIQDQVANMEQREIKDQVWAAIDSLPEREREAVMLFYIGGNSQQEMSEFLDVPVTTIKKRLFSARRRLREMLIDIVADTLRSRRPSRNESFAASVIAMLAATRNGDVKRVRELLEQSNHSLKSIDQFGNTALIVANNSGRRAVAELLLKAGVRPDIHEAAAIGETERVARLLEEDMSRLNSHSAEGFHPLLLAATFGHRETTEYLLDQGASIDLISLPPTEATSLHAALFEGQVETARLLIERGADVKIRRGDNGWPRAGWTALHYAAGCGLTELIEPLITYGADVNAHDGEGRTPLDVAIEEKQDKAAELLRQKSAREQ